ncbi:DUF6891 domain-containing protein [Sphingobium sp. CAP-1]|uniref:DUF6891 domain-containing protein n=1 Tax=Sphingobium sp. CAP-1 TaxID=2676077 RepID=UPI0012BB3142|nr:hypothetical protein [Sphingobium sp. CAP-1]QGP79676.1 hypothetical protein GL174_12345 [Sphingobium sp. CAP-1]
MFGALWNRIFGTRRETSEQPGAVQSYDPVEALRDLVRRDVAGGFYDDDAILTNANEVFEEELPRPLLRVEASAALRAALADHRSAEQGWSDITDCDRLDAAFALLEAEGVIARQNFTCCGTCGASEIWDEIEAAQAEGAAVQGYAFFHMQDTESAVEGHGLYLNYGACEEGEAAAIAVGHRIVAALEAQGLTTDWDGRLERRIAVALEWKKRRGVRVLEG